MISSFLRVVLLTLMSITVCQFTTLAQTKILKSFTKVNNNIPGYYIYLPESYYTQPQQKYPVIVFINGLGATGNGSPEQLEKVITNLWGSPADRSYRSPGYFNFPTSFTQGGKTYQFIIAAPQFISDPWSSGNTDINAFLDHLESHYRVATDRVYLTGQSSGGIIVLNFVGANPKNAGRIAGVISASPAGSVSVNEAQIIADNKVAIWLAAATADDMYGPGGAVAKVRETERRINNANPTFAPLVSIIETPNGNHGSAASYIFNDKTVERGLSPYQWMLSHNRAGVLAVSDLTLAARPSGQTVTFNWSASCEINSASYSIEAGRDGVSFQSIYTTASKNASTGAAYSFTQNMEAGSWYVRVKHQDFDGSPSYSNIVHMNVSGGATEGVRIYPNPVTESLSIDMSHAIPKAEKISIYNAAGKLYREIPVQSGSVRTVNVSSFPAGMYFGKITGGGKSADFSFIKK